MTSPAKAYVIRYNTGSNWHTYGAAQGWQVTFVDSGSAHALTLAQLADGGYTLLVIDASYAGLSATHLALAYQAYNAGLNVWLGGNDTTTTAGFPLWTGHVSVGAGGGLLSPVVSLNNHPVGTGWTSFADGDSRIHHTGLRATVQVVANFTYQGVADKPAIYVETNPNGNGARLLFNQSYAMPAVVNTNMAAWVTNGGGMPRVWNGSAWVYRSARYHNGSAWVQRPIKAYGGDGWKAI